MIDFQNERLLTLKQAANMLPPFGGRPVHPSTLWRWCSKGLNSVKLEFVKVGGRMCTSEEALNRFLNRDNSETPHSSDSKLVEVPESTHLIEKSQRLEQEGI